MLKLLLFALNFIVPIGLILYGIYIEIMNVRLRKRHKPVLMLASGGLFVKRSSWFHGMVVAYMAMMMILWLLSFMNITSLIHDIQLKYMYILSFALLAVSCTLNLHILEDGVLIGDKIYPFSEISNYVIQYDDTNNARSPYSKKMSVTFTGHKRPRTYWIDREDISKFTELMSKQV